MYSFILDQFLMIRGMILYLGEFLQNFLSLRAKYQGNTSLQGKVAVITGANTGLGKETALQLSLRDAEVIIGCRDEEKGRTAVEDIKAKNPNANITCLKLDLSSLASVRQFARNVSKKVSAIDILVSNAGVFCCPEWQSEEGYEMHFATNHLGHFLLTLSLLPLLKKSSNARVITVSSNKHMISRINFDDINLRNAYSSRKACYQSKLANVLFSRELAKRLGPESTVRTYCLHPGTVKTDLCRHLKKTPMRRFMMKYFFTDVNSGAQTTLYCALEPSLHNQTGLYYDDCKCIDDSRMSIVATDEQSARLLWEMSSDLVQLEDNLKLN